MQSGDDQGGHKEPEKREDSVSVPTEETGRPTNPESQALQQAASRSALERIRNRINWLTLLNVLVALSTIGQTFFSSLALQKTNEANQLTRESLQFARQNSEDGDRATAKALEIADRATRAAEESSATAKRHASISERGVVLAERSAQNRERPRIALSEILGQPSGFDGKAKSTYTLRFDNIGSLPAANVEIRVAAATGPLHPSLPEAERNGELFSAFNPDSWNRVRIHVDPFDDEDIPALTAGRHSVFLYGTVAYSDVSSRKYRFRFCRRYAATQAEWVRCPPPYQDDSN